MTANITTMAFRLADSAARSDIETMCRSFTEDGGEPVSTEEIRTCWYDTRAVIDPENVRCVEEALEYLECRGMLKLHPTKASWLRVVNAPTIAGGGRMNKGTCIHFTGLRDRGSCCKVGVNYSQAFDINKPGIMLRLPCIQYRILPAHGRGTYVKPGEPTIRQEIDRRGETMMPCEHFREPTDEEVEAERRETDAHLERTMVAIKVAAEWRSQQTPAQDRQEAVRCPICSGTLHLSQSAHNGHVAGCCETKGCVRWME